ncbi:MAG: hypothetical protein WCI04_07620 [archaeon]
MKEQYRAFIDDSVVVDSPKVHEELERITKDTDGDDRTLARIELAENVTTKDKKTLAEHALDSFELVRNVSEDQDLSTEDNPELRKRVLTELVQKRVTERDKTIKGYFLTFNTDGEIVNFVPGSLVRSENERELEAKKWLIQNTPSGRKQNASSFRRRQDLPGDKK